MNPLPPEELHPNDVEDYVAGGIMEADQVVPPTVSAASGTASLYRAGDDALCLGISTYRLTGDTVAVQVRQAASSQHGPKVVNFSFGPDEFGPDERGLDYNWACELAIPPSTSQMIFDAPEDYAVQVHTTGLPEGEIRGQLFADHPELPVVAFLHPDDVVPGPGAIPSGGSVGFVPTGVGEELCYHVQLGELDSPVTAVEVHRGRHGEVGPQVVTLNFHVGGENSSHCDRGVDPQLVGDMFATPEEFYVDVHTEAYPSGAARGQLQVPHVAQPHN